MHDIGVKFKSSEKHLLVLHTALKAVGKKVLNPKAYVETRWNSWIDVILRWQKIEAGVAAVVEGYEIDDSGTFSAPTVSELFTSTKTIAEKQAAVKKFKASWDLIQQQKGAVTALLPLLQSIAQWLQVLSAKKYPTINMKGHQYRGTYIY
jgi:hypothetical protein